MRAVALAGLQTLLAALTAQEREVSFELLELRIHRPDLCRCATSESVGWQNFGKMLLVFGCIGTDFRK